MSEKVWTEDELDDLVEEWHSNPSLGQSMSEFIREKTGWTPDQYEIWVVTGEMPIASTG